MLSCHPNYAFALLWVCCSGCCHPNDASEFRLVCCFGCCRRKDASERLRSVLLLMWSTKRCFWAALTVRLWMLLVYLHWHWLSFCHAIYFLECYFVFPSAFPSHGDRASRHHLWLSHGTAIGVQLMTFDVPNERRWGLAASILAFPSHGDRGSTHVVILLKLVSLRLFTESVKLGSQT